jgi:hypothetical protein
MLTIHNDILYLLSNGYDFDDIIKSLCTDPNSIKEDVLCLKLSGAGQPIVGNLLDYVPMGEINKLFRWGATNGHLEVVKYLVGQGADIHAGNDYALRRSAGNGHFKIVEYLQNSERNL